MNLLKKLTFLVSMPLTGILLMVLIISMAIATFVESSLGTNAAWALIFDAWWFELLFVIVLINLTGNIIISKLYKRKKLTVFTFHVAFIVIILGAGVTRFLSHEGLMHIREGEVSDKMISDVTFMELHVTDGEEEITESKSVRLSSVTPGKFRWSEKINGKKVKIKSVDYITNATAQYVGAPGGEPYLQMMILAGRQMTVGMTGGEEAEYLGMTVSFNREESEAELRIFSEGESMVAYADYPITTTSMGGEAGERFEAGEPVPWERGKLYSVNNTRIALQRYFPSAKLHYVQSSSSGGMSTGMDVVRLEVDVDGMKQDMFLPGMSTVVGIPSEVQMGSTTVTCSYGSKNIQLPFAIELKDFVIDRYPGSNSPSSFESDVVLIDEEHGINQDYNIYMNNVLKHRGYRFYQSSYDNDELGTILSVNKDLAGTTITYLGYFLLTLGMLLSLFAKGTRFVAMARNGENGAKAALLIAVMVISGTMVRAQDMPVPSKEQAAAFGNIWVQGREGRFKPMHTMSNEVVRKVLKKSSYQGNDANQVMMGMFLYPDEWKQARIFKVDNPEVHQLIGYKGTEVSFNDFISDGRYVLSQLVNTAYTKQVQERTETDKDIMKLDEKINIFYMVQTGALFKIFPDPDVEDGSWHSVADLHSAGHEKNDTLGQVFLLYTKALREGDSELAEEIVEFIGKYQETRSPHALDQRKKKAEVFYNKVDLFNRLSRFYGLFGITLLVFQFMRIFKPRRWINVAFKIGVIHLAVAFVLHTVFLLLRWYISGHAPMSNGYESMLFVSFVTMLAGLVFSGKSGFAISLTAILASLSLSVAHMSWMNPEITNLVPVLKSPWLSIHVTVIISGYGFLGLSMLMGLINLVFYSLLKESNKERISHVLREVTRVNQMSVIIGLYLLTVGTFLGGVWANESWGRYWGWDPKETWALISVLVYSFIVHMHMFPGMKSTFSFNLATVFGYFSILMTYFGVNYFLGGIHSYAAGDAFAIPTWVYVTVLLVMTLSLIAYSRHKLLPGNLLKQ